MRLRSRIRRLRLCRRRRRDQEDAIVPTSAPGPSSSPFFPSRIPSLSKRRNDLGSVDLRNNFDDLKIESSKRTESTWTETSVATSNSDDEDELDEGERERTRVAFEKLKEDPEWGPFFRRQPYELEIGEKIGGGGQGKIFEALGTNKHDGARSNLFVEGKTRLVVKVFNKGFSLEDLPRLWPAGLASAALPYRYFYRQSAVNKIFLLKYGLCWSVGAQLLEDGRFAFIFDRFWGDFRTVIKKRVQESNGAPPFSLSATQRILINIAQGMVMLHRCGLLHKDLKAANVLAVAEDGGACHGYPTYIADFESSVGTIGTGFWRAPEVLRALQKRSSKLETFTQQSDVSISGMTCYEVLTQQSDVYSYGMTCYEVLTGREPFEGHPTSDYDIILRGERPPLPDDIYPAFKALLRKCWHEDPLQRPSFQEIVADLQAI